MIEKSFHYIIRGILISIVLIVIGYVIAHFIVANPNSLDLTLFILGAIPIILFLPGIFSSSTSGALHTPKVIFRKVDTVQSKEAKNVSGDEKISFASPPSLVIAGLLTWLATLFIFMK